jgi:hypothetical protein
MNLTLHLILCGILLVATVCVAVYRKWLEDHCDNYIHLHNDAHDAAVVQTQEGLCRKLEVMTRLQTGLIAATIAYAVIIAAVASYNAWRVAGGA